MGIQFNYSRPQKNSTYVRDINFGGLFCRPRDLAHGDNPRVFMRLNNQKMNMGVQLKCNYNSIVAVDINTGEIREFNKNIACVPMEIINADLKRIGEDDIPFCP